MKGPSQRALVSIGVLVTLALTVVFVYVIRDHFGGSEASLMSRAELRAQLESLPLEVDGWRREPAAVRSAEDDYLIRMSGAQEAVAYEYVDPTRPRHVVELYLAGTTRNEDNFHAPLVCLPSGGWAIEAQDREPFTFHGRADEGSRFFRMIASKGGSRSLVYFWFQAGNLVADHSWDLRLMRFRDFLKGRPFHPALLVRAGVIIGEGGFATLAEAEEALQAFLEALGPRLENIPSLPSVGS